MTTDKMRIAIAECCGWKITREQFAQIVSPDGKRGHCCGLHLTNVQVWLDHFEPHEEKPLIVPNYSADLNAMAEAEKTLSDEQKVTYIMFLARKGINVYVYDFAALCATAIQRAEAFLRVKGLWKE